MLLWLLAAPVAATPLCLELELRRDITVEGALTEGELQKVKVVLTTDYLEFEDNDGRVVHDFLHNQSHLVSGDNYVRRSLYADIGFRVAELNNRMALLETLRKNNAGAMKGEEVSVEHLFAIDDETTEANISKTDGSTISYGHKGQLLAEFSASGRPLSPEQSKAFVRFVRYYCGGHPDILSDLQVRAVLPDRFRVEVHNVSEVISFRLRVVDVKECDPVRPDFSALRPTVLPPEPLGTLVALALQLSPRAVENAETALRARADEALTKGSMLEAALLNFEVLLMTGGQAPEVLANSRAAFEANPDSKLLFDALLAGAEDPARAAEMFKSLEGKVERGDHILKIFRAGMVLPLGQLLEARDLYVEALMVNPAIAGAWKDLGDIYHSNYETDMAWLCWDVGRKLSPGHEMLKSVTKLEQLLRSNYPGFF
jgi:tetratricopeptide (TPR) repeat protein